VTTRVEVYDFEGVLEQLNLAHVKLSMLVQLAKGCDSPPVLVAEIEHVLAHVREAKRLLP